MADLLILLGVAAITWGVHLIHPPSAFIVTGLIVATLGLFS